MRVLMLLLISLSLYSAETKNFALTISDSYTALPEGTICFENRFNTKLEYVRGLNKPSDTLLGHETNSKEPYCFPSGETLWVKSSRKLDLIIDIE
jgi:hypothetical protein